MRTSAVLVSLLTGLTMAEAADYYVAVTGHDLNPGTSTEPFRTIARGVSMAAPGDLIILKDGVYGNEGHVSNGGRGIAAPVKINTAGAPDAWITLRAENKWGAVLDCETSAVKLGCDTYIQLGPNAAYWSFEGLVLTRSFLSGIHSNFGASHLAFRYCRFEYIGNVYSTIADGMSGLGGDVNAHDWWIEGNIFHDIGRTGGWPWPNHDHGIYSKASNVTVINNIFYNLTKGWAIQTARGATNWLIANNTFAFPNTERDGQIVLWDANTNIAIRNNIFYNPRNYAITRAGATLNGCTIDHNIVYGSAGIIADSTGCALDDNRIGADPRFVNATSAPYDFHLRAGSPAIDTGASVGALTLDFDGTARPQGPAYDVGAYERACCDSTNDAESEQAPEQDNFT